MRALSPCLVALVGAAVLGSPVHAGEPCPDGATQQAQGGGYHCVRSGPDGRMQRHGWALLMHGDTQIRREECEYRDGVRHGRCSTFDEDGSLLERGSYARGRRVGAWWFWSIPGQTWRRSSLTLRVGEPDAARQRRTDVQSFLIELGADDAEASALSEALFRYVDGDGGERRQVCGDHLCLGPGRIPLEPIFVAIGSVPVQVERDRKLLAVYAEQARKRVRDEERAEKLERARQAAAARRLEREQAIQAAREARAAAREAASEEASEAVYEAPAERVCCKICDAGKPCGDSCIARNKTCHKGRGCAC